MADFLVKILTSAAIISFGVAVGFALPTFNLTLAVWAICFAFVFMLLAGLVIIWE